MAHSRWTYVAARSFPEDCGVTAWVKITKDGGEVENYPLHHFVRHSPTGFEMGYGGSGPADLAYSILVHWFLSYKLTMEEAQEEAAARYQEFKRVFIATADRNRLEIRDDQIEEWITKLGEFEAEEATMPTTKEGE